MRAGGGRPGRGGRRPAALGRGAAALALAAGVGACALATPLPETTRLPQRLAAIPAAGAPLDRPVTVHWNDHQVPFIEARTDQDLAVALGIVHAHLRLGQMEILRRISQGRVSEAVGPIAWDLDHSLRILDFGRAADEIVAGLPPETRAWLEGYVRGINHYLENVERLPHEFAVLGFEREPWRAAEVVTLARLAATDINWLVWFRALALRERDDWPRLWRRLIEGGEVSAPGPAAGPAAPRALARLLEGVSRSGSNSIAVAPGRSASGGALMANDPHLGLSLPNAWLIAGFKSPSYHAVGLMVPGLPFVALGRNPWIAWGGTNMHAASSELYDVSHLPPEAFTARKERLATRWWFDRTVTVRESELGPVISDAPVLDTGGAETLALRWMGHRPSDEFTAMLAVNRARDWADFRDALEGFAVPGQNILYADAEGHIGRLAAARLPRRARDAWPDIVTRPGAGADWTNPVTMPDLPARFDPPAGFVASANERPADTRVPVGFFFSPGDRIERLRSLARGGERISVADLEAMQRDVYMASSVRLRDAMLAGLDGAEPRAETARAREAVAAWDGHYAAGSQGALVFELWLHHFAQAFYEPGRLSAYTATWRPRALIAEDIAAAEPARLSRALGEALAGAAADMEAFAGWGEMHRLRLAHLLAMAPLIGGRYRFAEHPAPGGNNTLMKTAHDMTDERHFASYGSNARHISDLSDMDENYFVLWGGQDGWINSTTFTDQAALWRRGAYIRVPLRPETVRESFSHRIRLTP